MQSEHSDNEQSHLVWRELGEAGASGSTRRAAGISGTQCELSAEGGSDAEQVSAEELVSS